MALTDASTSGKNPDKSALTVQLSMEVKSNNDGHNIGVAYLLEL